MYNHIQILKNLLFNTYIFQFNFIRFSNIKFLNQQNTVNFQHFFIRNLNFLPPIYMSNVKIEPTP